MSHKKVPLSITSQISDRHDCAPIFLACWGLAIMADDIAELREITSLLRRPLLNIRNI
jgi:hypothetical protein